MDQPHYVIMPVMGARDLTIAAIADVLAQSIPTRLLIINQGVDQDFRRELEAIAEQDGGDRILCWSHDPNLPSLSATWNRALSFVWEVGGTEALVVNNDLRIAPCTYAALHEVMQGTDALFVSAVGVTEAQFNAATTAPGGIQINAGDRGGPDFSCFLISQAGHWKYPFDEAFVPAFCEDLDLHRRAMLGGDGHRIFSINLPYLHVGGGSNTLKSMTPEARAAHERRIGQSRQHYQDKWGGPVNQERWTIPFDPSTDQDGVTTPDLQRAGVPPTPQRIAELDARVQQGALLSDEENAELQAKWRF